MQPVIRLEKNCISGTDEAMRSAEIPHGGCAKLQIWQRKLGCLHADIGISSSMLDVFCYRPCHTMSLRITATTYNSLLCHV